MEKKIDTEWQAYARAWVKIQKFNKKIENKNIFLK